MMKDDEPQGIMFRNKLFIIELEDFPEEAPKEETEEIPIPSKPKDEVSIPAGSQRKKGKRKVLKKTTKRDEKGYLGDLAPINR
jgi:DNA polymerase subunit Cdc27